jgi:hypothetical protein
MVINRESDSHRVRGRIEFQAGPEAYVYVLTVVGPTHGWCIRTEVTPIPNQSFPHQHLVPGSSNSTNLPGQLSLSATHSLQPILPTRSFVPIQTLFHRQHGCLHYHQHLGSDPYRYGFAYASRRARSAGPLVLSDRHCDGNGHQSRRQRPSTA